MTAPQYKWPEGDVDGFMAMHYHRDELDPLAAAVADETRVHFE